MNERHWPRRRTAVYFATCQSPADPDLKSLVLLADSWARRSGRRRGDIEVTSFAARFTSERRVDALGNMTGKI